MSTRAILVNFKQYTPFGHEFYKPMSNYFIKMLGNYKDEFDTLYILDSGWNITPEDVQGSPIKKIEHIDLNPSLRYYDAYKEILPKIKEDLFLLMDNDMIIYKPGVIQRTFDILGYKMDENPLKQEPKSNIDVVTIMDTIGEYKTDKLKLGNKFCPYWFASRTELIKKYLDVDWGPDMPYCETLGHLTEEMLKDDVRVYELEDDKSNILLNSHEHGEIIEYDNENKKSKDLGYYHIRAGSTPAYLLATKKYGDIKTYNDYLANQPKSELLRQCVWYDYMNKETTEGIWKLSDKGMEFCLMLNDLGVKIDEWNNYMIEFEKYHGL